MHINSNWETGTRRTWRLRIYAMDNDETKLLDAVGSDIRTLP